jgi:MoaA/NifB/PqqE/SkfB family radical SAM enzyme
MIGPILKIPAYKAFRKFNFPRLLPLNLTVSVTNSCNSRCSTCRIHTKDTPEMTLDEYDRVFRSLGKSPYWVTISGGEPFLRKDISEILRKVVDYCRPRIITLATNGILTDRIVNEIDKIAGNSPRLRLIVNVSIDGIGDEHDQIRNVKDGYRKAVETFHGLKQLNAPNLAVGIHTVISNFNVHNFNAIWKKG